MTEIEKNIEICELRALICGMLADLENRAETKNLYESSVKEYMAIKHVGINNPNDMFW